MDLRVQTSLIAAMLSFALAVNVLLRPRKRRAHWVFATFGLSVALWYAVTAVRAAFQGELWERLHLVAGVVVPLAALQFFRAFVEDSDERMRALNRFAWFGATLLVGGILTPYYQSVLVGGALFAYVLLLLAVPLVTLYRRGDSVKSGVEGARLRYLAIFGGLGSVFTLLEYLPYVGLDIPPVGTLLVLLFLYLLSQSLVNSRLIDLYELAGRLGVLTALAFMLATMLWAMHYVTGGRFFLHGVVSALVVLLLFDPVRAKVTTSISQFFFRERYEFETSVHALRREIAHALQLTDLANLLMRGLERSRRVTHAALYLADADGRGYNLHGYVGPEPAARVEMAPARPLLDRLRREGAVTLEGAERELEEQRELGEHRDAETAYDIVQTMDALDASVALGLVGDGDDLYGFLTVRDERMRDAFSPEEVQLLEGLAAQAAVTVENSRLYQRMKERDRLAALGEMAAGLAHEIRNPLGSIKASAQYLTEPGHEDDPEAAEFLGIIVEEVDRLNRVVGGFLDYARPTTGEVGRADVNAVVRRTLQLMRPECEAAGVTLDVREDPSIPPVQIDVERLRQVILNLVQNAVQAMGAGVVRVRTERRERLDANGRPSAWVELRIEDSGPGIPSDILHKLFVPFFTTRDRGTGLGLAISQRIIVAAGGVINVRSKVGSGTTFVVHLPGDAQSNEHDADPVSEAEVSASTGQGDGASSGAISGSSPSSSSGGSSASRSAASASESPSQAPGRPSPPSSGSGSGSGAAAAVAGGSEPSDEPSAEDATERPRLVTTSR
ncbi:MAG: GAF domain-containing protein [Sandaracinaceae bacterium]|nr:GAF domain-containing protein [Sandaracinaceae bacterium]